MSAQIRILNNQQGRNDFHRVSLDKSKLEIAAHMTVDSFNLQFGCHGYEDDSSSINIKTNYLFI